MSAVATSIPEPTVATAATAVRFLAVWLGTLLGTWLLLTGFTAFVDPYNLIGAPRISGWNERKFEMSVFGRVGKLPEIKRRQPEAIILGNSQAEGGFRSGTLGRLTGQKAYNFSFLAAPIEETALTFDYAVEAAPIRTAVLAVDYIAFEGGNPRTDLMRERVNRQLLRELRDFAELTMSMQAVSAAIRGVTSNWRGRLPSHDADGNWSEHDDVPINDNAVPVAAKSPAESAYRAFDAICRLAVARGIDLRIIATPVHRAFGLDLNARALWVQRLRTIAAAHGLNVVDEGGDAAFNADKGNFFDRGHFTAAVGDFFLARLFADKREKVEQ